MVHASEMPRACMSEWRAHVPRVANVAKAVNLRCCRNIPEQRDRGSVVLFQLVVPSVREMVRHRKPRRWDAPVTVLQHLAFAGGGAVPRAVRQSFPELRVPKRGLVLRDGFEPAVVAGFAINRVVLVGFLEPGGARRRIERAFFCLAHVAVDNSAK